MGEKRHNHSSTRTLLILFCGIGLALLGFFLIYYYDLASGYLVLRLNTDSAIIKIDDHEVSVGKKISLKPGQHQILVSKDGYIEYSNTIQIFPLFLTYKTVELAKAFYVSLLPEGESEQIAFSKNSFLALAGNSVYRAQIPRERNYIIADGNFEKILNFGEAKINQVKFSPSGLKTIAFMDDSIVLHTFGSTESKPLSKMLIDASFLADDEIISIQQEGTTKRLVKETADKEIALLTLGSNAAEISMVEGNSVIILNRDENIDSILLVDLKHNSSEQLFSNEGGIINSVSALSNGAFFVSYYDDKLDNRYVVVTPDKKILDLQTEGSIVTVLDGKTIISATFELESKTEKIEKFELKNNKIELTSTSHLPANVPITKLVALDKNTLYYITDNNLMGMDQHE